MHLHKWYSLRNWNFKCILYADDTTLVDPLCSFTHSCNSSDTNQVSKLIDFEESKNSDWLSFDKLPLNAEEMKCMIFHNYQNVIAETDIPHLTLNDFTIAGVPLFNFLRVFHTVSSTIRDNLVGIRLV